MTFHPDTLPSLKGKVYIVTGGNSGIGYHTAAHLAAHDAHVYLCARSIEKGTAAIARIKETHPTANIDLLQMDHMNLTSVVSAAKRFLTLETALHGLVNNAGIMATPFQVTKDGHEAQWQTNYLAHWTFTEHLLPLMLSTSKTLAPGSVRIVNMSSSGHWGAPKQGVDFTDTSLKNDGPWERYGQSKLGNILHTTSLHTRYGPGSQSATSGEGEIWVSAVHPGLVETNLGDAVKESGSRMVGLFSVFRVLGGFITADMGSWTNLFCVASPSMKFQESGGYFDVHRRFLELSWLSCSATDGRLLTKSAKDGKLAEKLHEWTLALMEKEGFVQ